MAYPIIILTIKVDSIFKKLNTSCKVMVLSFPKYRSQMIRLIFANISRNKQASAN